MDYQGINNTDNEFKITFLNEEARCSYMLFPCGTRCIQGYMNWADVARVTGEEFKRNG